MGKKKYRWQMPINYYYVKIITKTRFEVKVGEHTYEVDEFYEENEGLLSLK
jgi:CYTH domain-containing protein